MPSPTAASTAASRASSDASGRGRRPEDRGGGLGELLQLRPGAALGAPPRRERGAGSGGDGQIAAQPVELGEMIVDDGVERPEPGEPASHQNQ